MKNLKKPFGIILVAAAIACAMAACELAPQTPTQTPVEGDYNIGNLTQYVGSVTAVTITPKSGKSGGARTIYYAGAGSTTYGRSTTLPTAVGTYTVTFDVAAASGWYAASDLTAGTLTINTSTPVAGDYDISGLAQSTNNVKAVTVTPKAGKSSGTVKVYYAGTGSTTYEKSTAVPTTAASGSNYAVTFDVAAATGWNAATGLSAGTMEVNDNKTPVVGEYTISGTGTFNANGSARTVTVTPKANASPGAVTVKYNGSTTAPSAAATYTVTFDVAAATGWNAATALSAGTLEIKPTHADQTVTVTIVEPASAGIGNPLVAYVQRNFAGVNEYQWLRDDTAIEWATNYLYTPELPDDLGKEISVKVAVKLADGTEKSGISAAVTIPSSFTWKVDAYRSNRDWLTALVLIGEGGGYSPNENGFGIKWFRAVGNNSKAIDGATYPHYELQADDAGKTIYAKVTYNAEAKNSQNIEILENEPFSLKSTVWEMVDYPYSEDEEGELHTITVKRTSTLSFTSDTAWTMGTEEVEVHEDGTTPSAISPSVQGTYTLNLAGDRVVLNGSGRPGNGTGNISVGKIVFYDSNGNQLIFLKQESTTSP